MRASLPPEWAEQDWLWIGFPHDAEEWPDKLARAQEQIAGFANAVSESGQEVRLLVRDAANEVRARQLVTGSVKLERRKYGDIWMRDTGPLVMSDGSARRFGFNGWGGKYRMPGDETIGAELARDAGCAVQTADWILEGGAIDVDGEGRLLTTEECLLNPNRNPGLSRYDIEARLREKLGVSEVIWLGKGLVNDHTDGHVDNLARFVAPGAVALPQATGPDDPNAAVYADAAARIDDTALSLFRIPSPGRIEAANRVEPASYANFAITTHLVVVPTFGSLHDEDGVAAVAQLFPDRATIGLPADAILAGGGGFHCASQQMPRFG